MSINKIRTALLGFAISALTATSVFALTYGFDSTVATTPAPDGGASNATHINDADKSEPGDNRKPSAETVLPIVTKPAASQKRTTTANVTVAAATIPTIAGAVTVTTPVSVPTVPSEQTPVQPEEPAVEPSFYIILREEDAVLYDLGMYMPGTMHYDVPFDVFTDEGFSFDWSTAEMYPFGCTVLSAPTTDHGLLCHAGQKEADLYFLSLQYNDSTAPGHYVIEVAMYYHDTVRIDVLEFDLVESDSEQI